MRNQLKGALVLALVTLLAGCEGTGPNTQQGAVTGGLLGAIAGGIIGNNHGHQSVQGALIGGALGAIAGGIIGNSVDHQQGTIYRSEAEASTNVAYAQVPPMPPAPAQEMIPPSPTPSAVWISGYWYFDGSRNAYVWIGGHWEIPPPEATVYVAPHWTFRGGYNVYIRGYWR